MVSDDTLEINSTCFIDGQLKKKTNVGILRNKKSDCGDMLSLARDASATSKGFRYIVSSCVGAIARQSRKFVRQHSKELGFLSRNRRVRESLCKTPKPRKSLWNPFPTVPTPVGFSLSSDLTFSVLEEEVARCRPLVLRRRVQGPERCEILCIKESVVTIRLAPVCEEDMAVGSIFTDLAPGAIVRETITKKTDVLRPYNRVLKEKRSEKKERTLRCLVDAWKSEVAKDLNLQDVAGAETRSCEPKKKTIESILSMIRARAIHPSTPWDVSGKQHTLLLQHSSCFQNSSRGDYSP